MNSLKDEEKRDRRLLFVIALIFALVVFYILDMTILAWRL